MSFQQLIALSGVEIIGDFALKEFANKGGIVPLTIGILGYIGVVAGFIISVQNSTILLVNAGWDGISGILESVVAYSFLGERLENHWQYIGILFISIGLYLLKIPWKKNKPFVMPHI